MQNSIIPETQPTERKEAPQPGSPEFLDLSKYVREIRDMYKEDLAQDTFNCLLLGPIGSGKTTMVGTARKPIWIHSFDPGGTKSLRNFNADDPTKPPRNLIEDGVVVADTRYEGDDSKLPKSYKLWEKEFERMRRRNYFEHLGTYCLDSFTTWLTALKYEVLQRQGRNNGIMARQDWQILGNIIKDTINVMTALPCDVILTGHLTAEKDDVSGMIQTRIDTIPSLQNDLPILFDEIYCLESQETSEGVKTSVVTRSTGKYIAGTRIGSGGIFDVREEPNFKNLLSKAGYNIEDKPL